MGGVLEINLISMRSNEKKSYFIERFKEILRFGLIAGKMLKRCKNYYLIVCVGNS